MATQGLTVRIPDDQTAYVEDLIESGEFATAGDVVRAAIEELRDRRLTVEQWLRKEVLPVALAMQQDSSSAIPIDEVFAEFHDPARRTE